DWLSDLRFETTALRNEYRQERLALVAERLKERSRADWIKALDAADVPCMPVLQRHEILDDPQVQARELIALMEQPHVGAVRQAKPAARFDQTPAHSPRPAPTLSQHAEEVLIEAGYNAAEISRLRETDAVR
ncbi:MAG: crotonobetainyl-CoA:carnitine CoA-transferase CaiB-like acyl-CoA transferase, partial [Gammaproteobacteria bacterium]